VEELITCIEWNCFIMQVDIRPSFSHLHQFQVFLDGCFQVLEVFKKLATIIFKSDVDQNGT
jgi:hypothetical protein